MLPLILFFGEMVPKSVALRLGESWARVISAPLQVLAYLITPVRVVLQSIASAVLTIIGARPMTREEGLREEEFRSLVDVGSESGELQVAERRLIHNVFEFGDTTVGKVMTPADKVFALPYEMPLGRMVEAIAAERYSRVPIYKTPKAARGADGKRPARGAMEVVGILLAKDLTGYAWGALEGHTVQDLLHPLAVRAAHDQVRSAVPRVPAQAHARRARRRRVRAAGGPGDHGGSARGALRRDRRRERDAHVIEHCRHGCSRSGRRSSSPASASCSRCSSRAAELSVISVDRMALRKDAEDGARAARLLERFLENKQRFLATTLFGTQLSVIVSTVTMTYALHKILPPHRAELYLLAVHDADAGHLRRDRAEDHRPAVGRSLGAPAGLSAVVRLQAVRCRWCRR